MAATSTKTTTYGSRERHSKMLKLEWEPADMPLGSTSKNHIHRDPGTTAHPKNRKNISPEKRTMPCMATNKKNGSNGEA